MYDFSVTIVGTGFYFGCNGKNALIWHPQQTSLHILSTAINHEVRTLLTNDKARFSESEEKATFTF